ncbi:hypothetical protein [Robbsia andropogonis]|uniref:hypothetical protein n=1 Tax=Robbsia andropogonis TaxID=28092 RepID=UPI000465D46C|nr:hypothetical protein [Robbsia andropogonis]
MEKLFMSRKAVIAWLIEIRRKTFDESPAGRQAMANGELAVLDRLILDVRAARVDTFAMRHPRECQVMIAAD